MKSLLLVVLALVFGGSCGILLGGDETRRTRQARWDPAWSAQFQFGDIPGVAWNAETKEIWAVHRGRKPVQRFDDRGTSLGEWPAQDLGKAHQIRLLGGFVWIVDQGHHVVRKFTPEGKLVVEIGTPGKPGNDATHLNEPTDVALVEDGRIYVSDGYRNRRVVVFDPHGKYLTEWGEPGKGASQFRLPHSLVYWRNELYVADRANARIQVFSLDGDFKREFGGFIPWSLSVGPNDQLYLLGSHPQRRRVNAALIPDHLVGIPPIDQILFRLSENGIIETWELPQGTEFGRVQWAHGFAVGEVDGKTWAVIGDIQGKHLTRFFLSPP